MNELNQIILEGDVLSKSDSGCVIRNRRHFRNNDGEEILEENVLEVETPRTNIFKEGDTLRLVGRLKVIMCNDGEKSWRKAVIVAEHIDVKRRRV